jgi:hypothetical protein
MPTVNETRLERYLAAEEKILAGQSFQFGDRRLQRADLQFVQSEISRLQAAVNYEKSGRRGPFSQANFGGTT